MFRPEPYILGAAKQVNSITRNTPSGLYMVLASGLANVPSGFEPNWSCFAVVYKRTDQQPDTGAYTCIDLWHISEPQNKFIGTFGYTGDTITWYQDYNTSLLTNSALLGPLASALGVIKLNHVLLNITGDDPAINVINLGETQSGFLFLGLGGGASRATALWVKIQN